MLHGHAAGLLQTCDLLPHHRSDSEYLPVFLESPSAVKASPQPPRREEMTVLREQVDARGALQDGFQKALQKYRKSNQGGIETGANIKLRGVTKDFVEKGLLRTKNLIPAEAGAGRSKPTGKNPVPRAELPEDILLRLAKEVPAGPRP